MQLMCGIAEGGMHAYAGGPLYSSAVQMPCCMHCRCSSAARWTLPTRATRAPGSSRTTPSALTRCCSVILHFIPTICSHAGGPYLSELCCRQRWRPSHVLCCMQNKDGSGWHKLSPDGPAPTPRGWFASCTSARGLLVHGGNSPSNERLGDMYLLSLH